MLAKGSLSGNNHEGGSERKERTMKRALKGLGKPLEGLFKKKGEGGGTSGE